MSSMVLDGVLVAARHAIWFLNREARLQSDALQKHTETQSAEHGAHPCLLGCANECALPQA